MLVSLYHLGNVVAFLICLILNTYLIRIRFYLNISHLGLVSIVCVSWSDLCWSCSCHGGGSILGFRCSRYRIYGWGFMRVLVFSRFWSLGPRCDRYLVRGLGILNCLFLIRIIGFRVIFIGVTFYHTLML